MSLNRKEIFEFGEFRLDVNEHTIERIDGVQNGTLTEKAFQALVLLVRRRGHLVSKDELIKFIWPDTIVEDNNLEKCIHHLRHFLGEAPDKTGYIDTVRKHGYRFVGNVQAIEVSGSWIPETFRFPEQQLITLPPAVNALSEREPESETTIKTEPTRVDSTRPTFLKLLVVTGIVLVSIGTLTALSYYFFIRSATQVDGRKSIAVLPLRPIDPANRSDIHEVGMADALIHRLSSIKGFIVRPLNAMRKYTEIDQDPLAAGREQKVDYVVASNYQIANGRIKVTSQLLDVAASKVEEAFTVEQDSTDLFSAQDAIAEAIGNKLIARFGGASASYEPKRGTINEEAYRLYLQGMYLTEKYNRKDAAKAIETFDEALRLDPTYAAAWAGKAHAHCNFAHRGGSAPIVEFANAEPALDKALALDKNNADAYAVRGIINRDYHWNFAKAYANLNRALELDPNHVFARRIHSGLLTLDGRHDEAIVEIKKAIDLNPSWIWEHWLYAHALIQARRYDEAIRQSDRVLEMDPDFAAAYSILWRASHLKGDHLKAYENFLKGKRLSGSSEVDIAKLEAAHRDSGWFGVLRADRDARVAKLESDYSPAKYDIAGLSAVLGDSEGALKYLNECLDNRLIGLSLIKVDPFLDGLRGDPRFEELVRKTGL